MRTGTRLGAGISTAVVLLAFYGSAHAQKIFLVCTLAAIRSGFKNVSVAGK